MQACPGVLPPAARAQPVCAIQPLASNFPPVTAGSTDATPERMAYAKDVIPDERASRPRSVTLHVRGAGGGRHRRRTTPVRGNQPRCRTTSKSPTVAAATHAALHHRQTQLRPTRLHPYLAQSPSLGVSPQPDNLPTARDAGLLTRPRLTRHRRLRIFREQADAAPQPGSRLLRADARRTNPH